jgi:glycosyltransferase involved in cell wall biosynthesis
MATARILYISYDGMLEPLGQSQVLAYLERLALDFPIELVSFEKPSDWAKSDLRNKMRDRIASAGIVWHPLTYHKSPSAPATAYDVAVGSAVTLWLIATRRVTIVHARSYVPALMALVAKRFTRVKFVFDMRGFWADERTDGGLWPEGGRLYRIAKSLERRFLLSADHVVTLTHASAEVLAGFDYLEGRMPPVSVITTCADLERFRPQPMGPARPFTFGYVGSVGTWYLWNETLAFFKALVERRPDARLLVVNRKEHEMIRAAVAKAGIAPERLELVAAEHREVPALVARMHAAGALIRPCFSKIASAPTKLAEYLGCGVPCVGNIGVGDMEDILEQNRVGVVLRDFSETSNSASADKLLALVDEAATPARCRATAERLFSLDSGVVTYSGIYRSLSDARDIANQRRHAEVR